MFPTETALPPEGADPCWEPWPDDELAQAPPDEEPLPAYAPPSGVAAFELDSITTRPDLLSAGELIDAVTGFERLIGWATARQHQLIAAFHTRPADGTARPAAHVSDPAAQPAAHRAWAADEIGLALTLAPAAAASRVAQADRFARVLRPTRDLLAVGALCPARARLVHDMLIDHDDQVAAAVQARVLPRAPQQTKGQLQTALTRAIIAVVPDPEQRHHKAKRGRRVDLYPARDGMATLSAFLTATEATASYACITRLARGVLDPGVVDPGGKGDGERGRGSMDRRRADILTALLTGRLTANNANSANSASTVPTAPAPGPTVSAPGPTAPAPGPTAGPAPDFPAPDFPAPDFPAPDFPAAHCPKSSRPATPGLGTPGPAPSDIAADSIADDSTAGDGATPGDKATEVGAAEVGAAEVGAGTGSPPAPAGTDEQPWSVLASPVSAHRPLIHITVPISALLGLDNEPAELTGYGPLPADIAREIAANPDSTWRRLLTDPLSGQLLDYGRTTYRPPTGLTGFVRARDGSCRYPGCRRPAIACEIDHVQPWQPVGATAEDNLCALCERHHDLKHEPGWHVVLHDDRRLEWTTPTGHHYCSRPVEHPTPPPPPPPADPAPPPPPPPPPTRRTVEELFTLDLPRPDHPAPF